MKIKKKNNVIPFPKKPIKITNDTSYDYFEEYNDFEDWEDEYWLLEKKKYRELIIYRKNIAEKNPDDPHAQYLLGEAYVLNKEYKKAITFLHKIHGKWPDYPDVQYSILDALYAQGLCEKDFKWIEKPEIFKLNKSTLDRCYDYLKPKKKPRSISDLQITFIIKGYVAFSEEELFSAILNDDRFIVEKSNHHYSATVRITRKKDFKK